MATPASAAIACQAAQTDAANEESLQIHVKTMAGDLLPLRVAVDELVASIKRSLYALDALFEVKLQRLVLMHEDCAAGHTILSDDRPISSYVASEAVIELVRLRLRLRFLLTVEWTARQWFSFSSLTALNRH